MTEYSRILRRSLTLLKQLRAAEAIRASEFFDEAWYLETYPDVKRARQKAALHYLRFGAGEGRDPSAKFSSKGYLVANPDVARAGVNPLLHYIKWGRSEGRSWALESDSLDFSGYRLRLDSLTNTRIRGWCVNASDRSTPVKLELFINGISFGSYVADSFRPDLRNKGMSTGFSGLEMDNPIRFMRPGQYHIHFRLPDGSVSKRFSVQNDAPLSSRHIHPDDLVRNGVTIVVPIYNAPRDLEVCIERLLAWTPEHAEILLINDKSTDPEIETILARHADNSRLRILHNETNLGFTRTANRGITEAGRNDVLLLNSDARVTPGWLEGMLMAAASSPRVATVTAMSDRAGAFSAPKIGNDNELPPGIDEITFSRSFRRASAGVYPEVPTGNGFCMLIRRTCLDEVGMLDDSAFPRGYGEENDFCMRALHAGWKHVIDDRTYVFHDRSKSFGDTKTQLLAESSSVIRARYPEYRPAIAVFEKGEKVRIARYNGQLAYNSAATGATTLPRILFVISTVTGGTPQTNKDLAQGLNGSIDAWLLRCDRQTIELSHLVDGEFKLLRSHRLETAIDPVSHYSAEYDAVVFGWLFEYDIDIVHIRHLAWHSLSLPSLAGRLGRKTVTSFHDYYTLTPTIKLIDDADVFLGNYFTPEMNQTREGLWPGDTIPLPTGTWLETWRRKFDRAVSVSDAFVTTSEHARELICQALPNVDRDRFFVIPHGRDFDKFHSLRQQPDESKPIKILVPGNINNGKGLQIIYNLVDFDTEGRIEFHILGGVPNISRRPHPRIVMHGRYSRESFASKVKAIAPHLGAVFSIWDETYCHTLTELWHAGIPTIVFDFPTLAGRVRACGGGWVMDHSNIEALYNSILSVSYDEEEQARADDAVMLWQKEEGAANTTRMMASRYYEIYSALLARKPVSQEMQRKPRIAVVCPAHPKLETAYASTYIRVWERTINSADRGVVYVRMLPNTLLASARSRTIDAAIIQRTAIPPELVDELVSVLNSASIPFVYEIDDDLLAHANRPDAKIEYSSHKDSITRLVQDAAVVTVSTEELVKRYEPMARTIRLVPNRLSDRLWRIKPNQRPDDGVVRALYMGTRTHDADLEMILPILAKAAERFANFRLTIVGVTGQPERLAAYKWIECVNPPVEQREYDRFVPWLRKIAAKCDFGLAPLVDTPFNRCKSALKILDYAALGLPVLASDMPQHHIDAPLLQLVSADEAAWEKAILSAIEQGMISPEIRMVLRKWVLSTHMLNSSLQDYDAMLGSLSDARVI
ncbi:glycosyltransferase [Allorhizobium undicola]|uniref:glycosyltransferase n=1 Tax=Allorhizobium undicola TaxID=78527 RepID=UPI0012B61373|nr:glycosyltransferase [Allorhizobium undicola]